MDPARDARIEEKLDDLLRTAVPRAELDQRFDRLEDQVSVGMRYLAHQLDVQGSEIASMQTKLERVDQHEERLLDAEGVTARQKQRDSSRTWLLPMVANVGGILISATIAAVTFLVGHGHHG